MESEMKARRSRTSLEICQFASMLAPHTKFI